MSFYYMEQTTKSHIKELHHDKAQINQAAFVNQDGTGAEKLARWRQRARSISQIVQRLTWSAGHLRLPQRSAETSRV